MPKFPDPTKDYVATPVTNSIDASKFPKQEESPVESKPQVQPPPTSTNTSQPAPSYTTPVSLGSPFRNLTPIIFGVVALCIIGFIALVLVPKLFNKTSASVTLNYWGLWEPASVMQGVIADYEAQHPNIKINYTMESPKNYRTRVLSSANSTNSPDIIRIHNTWLPMLKNSLSPAPDSVLKVTDLASYYPVVQKNFVSSGKIYALPFEIDGLALLYNKDIFKEAGIADPPTDWNALRKLAFDLTKTNPETKVIERAGVALGTTGNVDNWSDILGLLILQNSGTPGKPSEKAVQEALTFYTMISTQDGSWDDSQPNSIYAFATGSVAMIIAPSWQISEIKALNKDLNFGVAPTPTLPSANVAWATYWAEAVPVSSKNAPEAWKFIKYLSTPEVQQKMYLGASQVRALGEPYALTSLSSTLSSDPYASTYVSQGPAYSSWYLSDRTYDDGVNDQFIKYYKDAVNAINEGSSVAAVQKTLEDGVKQIQLKYPEAK